MGTGGRESRKTVTVLFCDVVHSTGLAEGIDPEALRQVMSRYFDEMSAAVEAHGGTVEKFIGDEVMAVFGVPVVHEDDALRAVRTAADMHERLERLNTELEQAFGLSLQVRIGINTGEVMAGDPQGGHGFITGEPVVLAKRLEQAAAPGDILIGKATYPLIKDAVTVGPLERFPAKGKRDHAERRRIDQIDPAADGVARRLDQPIIGRQQELHQLDNAFQQTIHEQRCRLLTLLGPAGIGKSRLAHELATRHHHHATTSKGRCLPYGNGITYWPLAEAVWGLGGDDAFARALDGEDDAELVLDIVRSAIGASPDPRSSEETFWAVRRAFEALARTQPLLLILEDIHWAEPTFLDLIEYLAGWSQTTPILLLCLARPELLEQRPTWATPHDNTTTLTLNPLPPTDIDTLLEHLSGEAVDETQRDRIASAAEGNPLFAEQMAAMAAENGGADELPIPPTIQAVLAERLDRLDRDERTVIERASVIGRDFAARDVVELSPPGERDGVSARLLSLVRKGFVRPELSQPGSEDRFRFQHVLVRDTAYEGTPKGLRAELHERLAEWLETAGLRTELEELVGYHLEQAYRARLDLGRRDAAADELAARASGLLSSAGRRALARGDSPAAASLLGRARFLVESSGEPPAAVLVDLGAALRESGRLAEAEATLSDSIEAARLAGDPRVEARADIERSYTHLYTGDRSLEDFERLAERAALAAPDDDAVLAKARMLAGSVEFTRLQLVAAEETLEQAFTHARRAGDLQQARFALSFLIRTALVGPRPVDQALERARSLVHRAPEDRMIEAATAAVAARLEAMRGRFTDARGLYARAYALFEELGRTVALAAARSDGAAVERLAGDLAAAERELRAGVDASEALGERSNRSSLAALLAETLAERGKLDEAEVYLQLSDETTADEDVVSQIVRRLARARLLVGRGRNQEAESVAREAVAVAADTDSPSLQAETLAMLGHALRAHGATAEADEALLAAERRFGSKGDRVSAERVRALRAVHA